MQIEKRLHELGINLPPVTPPVATYVNAVRAGNLLFLSGKGPTEADGGVCTLRGLDAVAVLEREFGVAYSLKGAYDLLHRLGFSCLRPRSRHRKNEPAAMDQFRRDAPLLSSE